MASRNYLIGRGELLTEPVGPPRIKPKKVHPYTVEEARQRLAPQLATTLDSLDSAESTSANGVHVVKFALHPSYVAKSYYPSTLFQNSGLEPVGSRDREIVPSTHVRANWQDQRFATSEIYVAGTRESFARLHASLSADGPLPSGLDEIREIEEIAWYSPEEKIKPGEHGHGFELVLHLPSARMAPENQEVFLSRARELGFEVRDELAFEVRGLWFVPADGPVERVADLAAYSTLEESRA